MVMLERRWIMPVRMVSPGNTSVPPAALTSSMARWTASVSSAPPVAPYSVT